VRLDDGQVGGRLVQASPGEVTPWAHQGQLLNHRDPAMTHHPRAGHDPVASHRPEEIEIHVRYR
jgi:hypothetical protein